MKKVYNSEIEIIESFLEMLVSERDASRNTVSSYAIDMKEYLTFLSKFNVKLINAQQEEIQGFMEDLYNRNIGARSVARKVSCLKQFYKFLFEDGLIEINPAKNIQAPKIVVTLPEVMQDNEIELLIKKAKEDKSPQGKRTYAILQILYSTGLRITELLMLTTGSFERNLIDKKIVNYLLVKGKGGKERVVFLSQEAVDSIIEYLKVRPRFLKSASTEVKESKTRSKKEKDKLKSDWLFPSINKNGEATFLTRQRFGQILKSLCISVGIDPNIASPHKLRHAYAMSLLKGGADLRVIQELMGHADISSTQVYTQIENQRANSLVMDKHPIAKK